MQPPPQAPTLTDGVVTLRAHREGDGDAVLAQCRDPEMQRWTNVPVPYERVHAQEWLAARAEGWRSGQYLAFAVEAGGRFCGSIDLRPAVPRSASVGFGLGPWARGRGLTARAMRLLLPWAFETLGLDVVHWSAVAGNWASRRVAWSVGFRVEGTVRGWLPLRDERADAWVGSLRRGDPLLPAHRWLSAPVVELGGLRLRPHRPGDAVRIAQACADPVTQHWLAQLPRPYATDDARAHLEQVREDAAAGRALFWAVADACDDRLLAEIGLFGLGGPAPRSCEVGYWTHPDARGRGVMTTAVRAAARHALVPEPDGGLGLERVLLRAAEGNAASRAVAARAGFRASGRDRRAELLRDGAVADLLRFDLVAGDLVAGDLVAGDPVAGDLGAGSGPRGGPRP